MDNPSYYQTVINYLAAAFAAVVAAFAAVYRTKVDFLEKERVNYVTHEDLEKHLDKLAQDRQAIADAQRGWHDQNTRRLERIEDSVTNGLERIHDRIDQIPVRGPSQRTRSTDR